MSGNTFGYHEWKSLAASNGQRPGMLLTSYNAQESRSGEGYHPLLEAGRLDGVASWGLGHKGRHPSWGNGRQKPHGSPL